MASKFYWKNDEKCIELLKVRRIAEANCQSTDLDCFKSPAYEEMLECIRHEFLDIKLESQAYFLHGWKPEALLLLELIAKDYAFQPIFANLTFTNDEPQSIFSQEDGQRITYYNHRLTQNMIQAAIQQNGLALEHLPSQYKDDIALIQSAIQQNGLALEFAPSKYKNQRDIVLAAVQQNGTALQFASHELRNDAEILSVALQSAENIEILKHAGMSLQEKLIKCNTVESAKHKLHSMTIACVMDYNHLTPPITNSIDPRH